jgi:hypothetical protein
VLRGGGAHIPFEELIAGFPIELINEKIEGVPYTPWQVLEHMRLAQWDILEFSRNASHLSPTFPEGYWPAPGVAADEEMWNKTVQAFRTDLRALENLVEDPAIDLMSEIAHGNGQTILREALLVADHNAYHLGALALMKRVLENPNR